jgi:hypothetical protein
MADSLFSWKTDYEDPGLKVAEDGFALLPPSTEFDNLAPCSHEWFEKVPYKGAFGSNLWIEEWTLLYEMGIIID